MLTHIAASKIGILTASLNNIVFTGCIIRGLQNMQTHRSQGGDLRDGQVANIPGRWTFGLAPNGESESVPLLCKLCMGAGKVQHRLLLLHMTSKLDAKKQL